MRHYNSIKTTITALAFFFPGDRCYAQHLENISGRNLPSDSRDLATADSYEMQAAMGSGAPTLRIRLTPVFQDGTATAYPAGTEIVGQELIAPSGGFLSVWNLQAESWDPEGDGPTLKTIQARINKGSLQGLNAIPSQPGCDMVHPYDFEPCTTNAHCVAAFGENRARCNTSTGHCFWWVIDETREDSIFFPPFDHMYGGGGWDDPLGPTIGFATDPCCSITDQHRLYYIATIVFGVPACAAGSYSLDFVASPFETFSYAGDTNPPESLSIAHYISGRLTINPCISSSDEGCPKNRYISIAPRAVGSAALRLTHLSLHQPDPPNEVFPAPDFSSHEYEVMYVGPSSAFTETETPFTTFRGAKLQCAPHYANWAPLGSIQVAGPAIVPSSQYLVEALAPSCAGLEDECQNVLWSAVYSTSRWGDTVPPFQKQNAPFVNQPNIIDIQQAVVKFLGAPNAISRARAQIQPHDINLAALVNISDVAAAIDGFKLFAYPYSGPTSCP